MYALVRHPAAVPGVRGIDGARLRAFAVDDAVDAIVSDSAAGTRPTEEAILAHAAVVQALADAGDGILPARFAAAFADEDDLRRRVASRTDDLLGALARVAGCVEMALRALHGEREAAAPPVSSGRAYMERRLGEVTGAERTARDVHDSLAALARESTLHVPARRDVLMTAAYLLPRGEVDRFQAAVARAQQRHPALMLVATGPWPPYSFALLDGDVA
jgi:hypothetical protein